MIALLLLALPIQPDASASWPFHFKSSGSRLRRVKNQAEGPRKTVGHEIVPKMFNADLVTAMKIDNVTDIVESSAQNITVRVDEFVKKALSAMEQSARPDIEEVLGAQSAKAAADLLTEIEETAKKMRPTAHKAERSLQTGMLEASRRFSSVRGLVTTKLDSAAGLVKGAKVAKNAKGAKGANLVRTGVSKSNSKSRVVAAKAIELARNKLDDASKLIAELNETANNLLNKVYLPIADDCVKLTSAVSERAAAAGDLPAFWDVADAATSLKAHIAGKTGSMPVQISEAISAAQSSLVPLVAVVDGLAGELGTPESK